MVWLGLAWLGLAGLDFVITSVTIKIPERKKKEHDKLDAEIVGKLFVPLPCKN